MKAVYLLPCTCGNKTPVDAGQAGTKVSCACGQQLAVPTFRGLRNLERESSAVPAANARGSSWSGTRGLLFSTGMLVTVISTVLVCYHLYFYIVMIDGGEFYKNMHLDEMRTGVDLLTPVEAITEFQDMATKGLTVDGIPPWSQITSIRDSSFRWLVASLTALTIGLVSICSSLLGIRRSKK
jgi:hypothetical protein